MTGSQYTKLYRKLFWKDGNSIASIVERFRIEMDFGSVEANINAVRNIVIGIKKIDDDLCLVDDDGTLFEKEIQNLRIQLSAIEESAEKSRTFFFSDSINSKDSIDFDYGWLEPDGTFHRVKWGEHESFAFEQLLALEGEDFDGFLDSGDKLCDRYGWILLHSPSFSVPSVHCSDRKNPTHAQREFLYDYFKKIGFDSEADRWLSA